MNFRDKSFRFATDNTAALGATLALATLLAYANTFSVPFVLDDTASIVENTSIRSLASLGSVLSPPQDAGVGGRPIANLSFATSFAFSSLDVRGYHVFNIGIHIAAALTLFGLLRRTFDLPRMQGFVPAGSDTVAAFSGALLWALHPLHTEAVTYISQRTESLMGLFYLLTLYSFARGVARDDSIPSASTWSNAPAIRWYVVAWVSCALGMATKEVMVTAPVVVLLYDRTFVAGTFREAWKQRRHVYLGLATTWALLAFLLTDVHERGVGYSAVTWWQYSLTECRAILTYLRLVFWPTPLVFDYGTDFVEQLADGWSHALAVAVLVGATAIAFWRSPRIGMVGAWIFVLLAPTSSVVPVAGQPIAEHRMYLPLISLVVLSAALVHRWLGRGRLVVTGVLGLALAYTTFDRNRDYRSAISLWTDTVEKRPENGRAHAALGAAYLEQGDLARAIPALQEALRLDPGSGEAHNNLATALVDANRIADAIPHFTASLRLRPGRASTHYNFGNALLSAGRTSEAIAQQQQAIILQPGLAEAHCALGNALFVAGRLEEAIARFRHALQLRPDFVPAHYGLANALAQAGQANEALAHYAATLRAVPTSVEAHYNIGNLHLQLGHTVDAIRHYSTAIKLKPDFAEAHNNLANALATSGRISEAIVHYETALQLEPNLAAARSNLDKLKNASRPNYR